MLLVLRSYDLREEIGYGNALHFNNFSFKVRKEKRQRFWDFLTMVSSVMYAFFVVVMGTACYMYDVLFR